MQQCNEWMCQPPREMKLTRGWKSVMKGLLLSCQGGGHNHGGEAKSQN